MISKRPRTVWDLMSMTNVTFIENYALCNNSEKLNKALYNESSLTDRRDDYALRKEADYLNQLIVGINPYYPRSFFDEPEFDDDQQY